MRSKLFNLICSNCNRLTLKCTPYTFISNFSPFKTKEITGLRNYIEKLK